MTFWQQGWDAASRHTQGLPVACPFAAGQIAWMEWWRGFRDGMRPVPPSWVSA